MSFDQEKLDRLLQQLRWVCAVLEKNLPPVLDVLEQEVADLREDLEAERGNASADQEDGGLPRPSIPEQWNTGHAITIQEAFQDQEEGGYSQEKEGLAAQENSESWLTNTQEDPKMNSWVTGPPTHATEKNQDSKTGSVMMGHPTCEFGFGFQTPNTWKETGTLSTMDSLSTVASVPSWLSLSVINPSDCEFLQAEKSICVKKDEGVAWQAKEYFDQDSLPFCLSWLSNDQLEKSTTKLVSTFPTFQLSCNFSLWQKNVEGLQLAGIFLKGQNCFEDPLGLGMSDGHMDFVFQESGPKLWLLSHFITRPTNIILNWALINQFLPTHLFILIWYKGGLIKMLPGSGSFQCPVDNLGFCNI